MNRSSVEELDDRRTNETDERESLDIEDPLREAIDSIEIIEEDDNTVSSFYCPVSSNNGDSLASLQRRDPGTRSKTSGVRHIEHLHRFLLPPPRTDVNPMVNILPNPVLPNPSILPQGFEMSSLTPKSLATPVTLNTSGSVSKFVISRTVDAKTKRDKNAPTEKESLPANSPKTSFWSSSNSQAVRQIKPGMSHSTAHASATVPANSTSQNGFIIISEPESRPIRNGTSSLGAPLLGSNNDHLSLPTQSSEPQLNQLPINFTQQQQQLQQPQLGSQQAQQLPQPSQQSEAAQQPQNSINPPQILGQRVENNAENPNPFDLDNENELGLGHPLKERMASLCGNEILADVTFVVGTPEGAVAAGVAIIPNGGMRTFPAHKCILVTASSVFYAMFCGGLASRNKDGDEIRVPDVDPDAFMAMLRFIYSEEINLEPESVLPTLYAAKKYMVNPLANECINFLEKNLKPENVCVILMQSKLYDEEELAEKCLRAIDMHTEEVLNSEGFLEVDHSTLLSLVGRDALSIPEIKLFEAVVRWAAAECLRQGLEPTPDQKRRMLGPVLHMIRIPTISLIDFSNHVSKSGLLTPEECVKMFHYFTSDEKPGNLDFNCEPRRKVGTERRCRRFPYFLHVSSTFYGLHSIAFKSSRKVAIVGFGLYGWAQGCACHVVTAQLMYQGNVIAETHQRITAHCPEDEPTYRVKFDNPVEINADVLYSACVILNGAQSYYGMDGKEHCEVDGVTFIFLNSMDGSNGTNVEHGQIPEIIFTEPL